MSTTELHPALTGAALPIAAAAPTTRRTAVSRELHTHADLAALLLLIWLAAPMIAAAASVASPELTQVTALDPATRSVSVDDLTALYELLFVGLACVLAISFGSRISLVPGRATGELDRDITGRLSVRVGALVAAVNFVALTLYTDAIAEAWIFPLLAFSTCQVTGVLIERLRHAGELAC